MAPTFLVVGATGNTGQNVVKTLSELRSNTPFADYKILALTRSSKGAVAQRLAQLPGVEVVEKNWVEITADWLRHHAVERAFVASHNEPHQFADESTFHLAALLAGVKYVVRISTTTANVHPTSLAYYPRSHWAIEALLSSPEFQALHWTSLQPNVFSTFVLAPAVEFVKTYRETGKQVPLKLMASEDGPVGIIHADDVGTLAAHLLLEEDTTKHNQAKYNLNGPEDITGQQIVKMVEDQIGTKVKDVRYKDLSFLDEAAANNPSRKHHIMSIKHAPETGWDGKCTASTTSKEVLEIAAPKTTLAEVFKELLGGSN
ncbi:hypothetical protein S40288_03078 [Stachybotrys chartarum IBT 40288]|nr:hypothetical protein S40288_03078 [Stachybotrys chartarum IBT 40288]